MKTLSAEAHKEIDFSNIFKHEINLFQVSLEAIVYTKLLNTY